MGRHKGREPRFFGDPHHPFPFLTMWQQEVATEICENSELNLKEMAFKFHKTDDSFKAIVNRIYKQFNRNMNARTLAILYWKAKSGN